MSAPTLQDMRAFTAEAIGHAVHLPENEFPYYFFGEEYMGWGGGEAFENFNPFEVFGITVIHHFVEVDDEELEKAVASAFHRAVFFDKKPLFEAFKIVEAINPTIRIAEPE